MPKLASPAVKQHGRGQQRESRCRAHHAERQAHTSCSCWVLFGRPRPAGNGHPAHQLNCRPRGVKPQPVPPKSNPSGCPSNQLSSPPHPFHLPLALARLRKAACAASQFSFLPPQALRVEACMHPHRRGAAIRVKPNSNPSLLHPSQAQPMTPACTHIAEEQQQPPSALPALKTAHLAAWTTLHPTP